MSALEQLKKHTTVVADTGDFNTIEKYKPQDATTNPSLIFAAAQQQAYSALVDEALEYGKKKGGDDEAARLEATMDKLMVLFGREILKIVPGRVSTEVDARLSYDTAGSLRKARELIALYEELGIKRERVLIKLASTWECIEAARTLEREGIHCNMTLMFSMVQAQACAEAGVTLISPFVGRIMDYYKARDKVDAYTADNDPGVASVRAIYAYYKAHKYATVVMGASFRNTEQIKALAGCDLLTIAPALLQKLDDDTSPTPLCLDAAAARVDDVGAKVVPTAESFHWRLCADEMAHFKTAEGIRKFAVDLEKLETLIKARF